MPDFSRFPKDLPDPVARAVEQMNDAFLRDPVAIYALLQIRVPCNASLADHPSVVVEEIPRAPQSPPHDGHGDLVGALGVINCVLHASTGYRLVSLWSDPIGEEGRRALLGFTSRKFS